MLSCIYDLAVALPLAAGYRGLALTNLKAREFFEVRQGMFDKLGRDCRAAEIEGRTVVLFHVASVGELLQAMPVMASIKNGNGAPVVALSYTSSSVPRNMPRGVAADIITPSPLDRRAPVKKFLDLLSPRLVVFSTYDIWPNFLMEAAQRGIPMILINGSLPENSGRLRMPGRIFFKRLYSGLRAAGAVTSDDAARFELLGLPCERARVTGNCRFDQTLARCRSVAPDDPDLSAIPEMSAMMVAGSTWPEDLARLLPALQKVMERHPDLGAVIAPHEPSPGRVAEVERFFAPAGLETIRYTRLRAGAAGKGARVVVVDTVGVLYKLYRKGTMAYVGGSFKQGVHNVMEPAGMGIPVIVGPVHLNSAEAVEMIRSGAAVNVNDADEMEAALERWMENPAARKEAGERALQVVEQNAGATSRTVTMVKEFLP